MTPKEKAFELYFKFYRDIIADNDRAKQCALIAVDEILEFEKKTVKQIESHIELFKEMKFKTESYYWQEVKQQIDLL